MPTCTGQDRLVCANPWCTVYAALCRLIICTVFWKCKCQLHHTQHRGKHMQYSWLCMYNVHVHVHARGYMYSTVSSASTTRKSRVFEGFLNILFKIEGFEGVRGVFCNSRVLQGFQGAYGPWQILGRPEGDYYFFESAKFFDRNVRWECRFKVLKVGCKAMQAITKASGLHENQTKALIYVNHLQTQECAFKCRKLISKHMKIEKSLGNFLQAE